MCVYVCVCVTANQQQQGNVQEKGRKGQEQETRGSSGMRPDRADKQPTAAHFDLSVAMLDVEQCIYIYIYAYLLG